MHHLNHIGAWSYVFFGISLVLLAVVRANGVVIAPLIIFAVSMIGVRFPIALTLLDRLPADAIWWSFALSSAFAVLVSVLYYKHGRWREARLIPQPRRQYVGCGRNAGLGLIRFAPLRSGLSRCEQSKGSTSPIKSR